MAKSQREPDWNVVMNAREDENDPMRADRQPSELSELREWVALGITVSSLTSEREKYERWQAVLDGLVEQLETLKADACITCQARDEENEGLREQLETALRVVEAAHIAYDGFGEDDHRFYDSQKRLAGALAVWSDGSSPASEPKA